MNIDAELKSLGADIKACSELVRHTYGTMNNDKIGTRDCECFRVSKTGERGNLKSQKGTIYHQHCVPPVKLNSKQGRAKDRLSKPSKKPTVSHTEHLTTGRAQVDVQVNDFSKATPVGVTYSFKRGKQTIKNHVSEKVGLLEPQKEIRSKAKSLDSTPVKLKTSWGNILKEQNLVSNPEVQPARTKTSYSSSYPHSTNVSETKTSGEVNKIGVKASSDFQEAKLNSRTGLQDVGVQCTNNSNRPNIPKSVNSAFSSYNPVRTMQFLMEEFRAKVKNIGEREEINNIVREMETTLLRLCCDGNFYCFNRGTNMNKNNYNQNPETTSHSSKGQDELFGTQFHTLGEENVKPLGNREMESKEPSSVESFQNKAKLQKKLEESCKKLENTSKQLELTCSRLREERDSLLKEITEREQRLEFALAKQVDCETRLAEYTKLLTSLTNKNEEYSKNIQELNATVHKLKEENKVMGRLKTLQKDMSGRLEGLQKENDELTAKNQFLELEKEKYSVILNLKDKELVKLRKDVEALGGLVGSNLQKQLSSSTDSSTTISSISGSMRRVKKSKTDDGLIASSPNTSSSSSSPLPYRSWQKVSSISLVGGEREEGGVGSPQLTDPPLPKSTRGRAWEPTENIRSLKAQLEGLFKEFQERDPEESEARSGKTVWSEITSVATTSIVDGAYTSLSSTIDHDTSHI